MKPVRFHSEAETEMNAAAAYYENEQSNLGKRFLASVQEAIGKIRITPFLYPVVDLGVRRCLTRTFPFGVLYRVPGTGSVAPARCLASPPKPANARTRPSRSPKRVKAKNRLP
jgi:hypothetical protein